MSKFEFDYQQVCSNKDTANYGIKCDICGGKFQSIAYLGDKAYCGKCYLDFMKRLARPVGCPENFDNIVEVILEGENNGK